MSIELVQKAIMKGAKLYASVSGGKDSQAMVSAMVTNGLEVSGLIHADLGRIEWKQSLPMCQMLESKFDIPLHVVKRSDGLGLIEYWKKRMETLKGQNKPFWSSSASRYCTSDLKRAPINVFFTSTGHNLIISCEGIRSDESTERSKKQPLSVRDNSSSYYKMDQEYVSKKTGEVKIRKVARPVEWCIENFNPKKKLVLTWFPIFNFTTEEVWNTFNLTSIDLIQAQESYLHDGLVPEWWSFHPAYVFGNQRVSCTFCVLGSCNDLEVGAIHNPEVLDELISMEEESGFTFKHKYSLKQAKQQSSNNNKNEQTKNHNNSNRTSRHLVPCESVL